MAQWRRENKEHIRAYEHRRYEENKTGERTHSLQYYHEHKEERKAYRRWWEGEHRKERNAYSLLQYYKHRDTKLASQHQYNERNRDKINARNRRWKQANRERVCHMVMLRKTRKRNLPATLTVEEAIEIRLIGRCFYCEKSFPPDELTLDHLVPLSAGGGTTRANMVAACQSCNSSKHIKMPRDVLEQLAMDLIPSHSKRREKRLSR